MKKIFVSAMFALIAQPALADHARPACDTPESNRLYAVSAAMYKASAEIHDPLSGGGSMNTDLYNTIKAKQAEAQGSFDKQGKQYLLDARAERAKKCPDIAVAIMENSPATADEMAAVKISFDKKMAKDWADLQRIYVWRKTHPQCHVVEQYTSYWSVSGGQSGQDKSKEDLRGINGKCSVDGSGPILIGDKQSSANMNPDKNDRIAWYNCSEAMRENGFDFSGDANLCSNLKSN